MSELRNIFSSSAQREKIERLLHKSPSPSLAKNHLLHLAENNGPTSFKKVPVGDWPLLVRLLGASTYLSDALIRQGRNWPEVFRQQIRIPQKTVAEHLAELRPVLTEVQSLEELGAALRHYKQREYLRIGTRDLLAFVTMEQTVRELSALADASLQAAYQFCRAEVEKDFGPLLLPDQKSKNRFVVLGMGKLGGAELNFSSDIDVIFLYEDDEGESAGGPGGKKAARDFFTILGKKIIYAMGEVTEDGFVFRMDLRLRPLGAHGPLVQSVSSAMLYYESWGQCWERSALIKARPVAGELELGWNFLAGIEPFVYRRYLDYTTVEELRHMKMRIENELLSPEEKQNNIKLGYGGIREIEFFTQALQLVNGGYEPRVRERNTLHALARLAECGYIPAREKSRLIEAYRFLRDVEHKVQMVQEAHVHSVPEGAEEQQALARRLGYKRTKGRGERELFSRDLRAHARTVRNAFDRLFYGAQSEMAAQVTSELGAIWNDLDAEALIVSELKKLGFNDPAQAYKNLLAVRDGEIYSPPSPKRLKVMRSLGPGLITAIAKSSAPDQALLNLSKFSHSIGGRTGFLSLLAENPETMRLLITLFADSQFLTDLFLNRPELIDSLIRVDLTKVEKTKKEMLADLRTASSEGEDIEAKLNSLRRYKAEEFIRIGLHDLGGTIQLDGVLNQLSDLAEACVEGALTLTFNELQGKFGDLPKGRFTVIGMGKMGGKEIDYNSDLDLVFIYDAPEDGQSRGGLQGKIGAHEYYVRVGQKLITYLSAPTEEGIAYKIDMQLRPSGKSGPLVSSLEGFREYHKTSSLLWERQALIKARSIAGDQSLGNEVEQVAEAFAYGTGLSAGGVGEIHHLRMRMENELAREDETRFNLKKGRGGLVDIEFLTQMLQLTHGFRHPRLRRRKTLHALKALYDEAILNKPEYQLLSEGYLFLRHLDHRLRLERDQSIDAFERKPGRLDSIAKALGYSDQKGTGKGIAAKAGAKLLRDYEVRREKIRKCYERYFLGAQQTEKQILAAP